MVPGLSKGDPNRYNRGMLRDPILAPRDHRLDDLLRRPLSLTDAPGSGGGDLFVDAASGWGFGGTATFRGAVIPSPLSLSVWVEGSPVFSESGVYRPSHITRNAVDGETGLQISEDTFVAPDDVLVCVLSLRNPGEWSVDVETRVRWGIERGEHADTNGSGFHVSRFAPNVRDRQFTLPAGGRTRLIFALSLAPDDRFATAPGDTARRRAEAYSRDAAPVVAHTDAFDRWAQKHTPRFDCPDPWAMRAWYGDCYLRRKYPRREMPPVGDAPLMLADFVRMTRRRFTENNFDAPSDNAAPFLPDVFAARVLGLCVSSDTLTLRPAPDLTAWESFAVGNYEHAAHRFAFVWDAPSTPGDAYHDGDKGFTVYHGDAVLHRQPDLSPVSITLSPTAPFEDEEDE